MLYFGALCSPWYLVGSVLLICLVFYVVLWCVMFTVETKQMSNTDPTKYHGEHKAPKYNIENEPDEQHGPHQIPR
jgi:hypothetical protein